MPLMPCIVDSEVRRDSAPATKMMAVGVAQGILTFEEECYGIYVPNINEIDDDQWNILDVCYGMGGNPVFHGDDDIGVAAATTLLSDDDAIFFVPAESAGPVIAGAATRAADSVALQRIVALSDTSFVPFTSIAFDTTAFDGTAELSVNVVWTPEQLQFTEPLVSFDPTPMYSDPQADAFESWFVMMASYAEWWTLAVYAAKATAPSAYLYWSDQMTFYDSMDIGEVEEQL